MNLSEFYREYYGYHFEDLSIAASAGAGTIGAFEQVVVVTDTDADFEGVEMCHIATSDLMAMRLQDDAYGRFMQNSTPLDLRQISGTILTGITPNGFKPYVWPDPYLVSAGNTFTIEYADSSGSVNLIRQSFHGAKLRSGKAPWDKPWRARFPFNLVDAFTVDANDTVSRNLVVGTDAHFKISTLMAVRTGAALVTVKDGDTDKQWTNQPMHLDNMFGNGQFPHELNAPRFVRKGSVISVTVQDLSGSSNVVRVAFGGVKLYE